MLLLLMVGLDIAHHSIGINSDRLCHIVRLVDTHELVSQLEHVVAQTNDNKLTVASQRRRVLHCLTRSVKVFRALLICRSLGRISLAHTFFDVLAYDGDILVVKGCVNLIHAVKWAWLEDVKGEDERQRTQCFLTTRQL